MQINLSKRELWFYGIQILSWGTLFGVNFLSYWQQNIYKITALQALIEWFCIVVLSITITTLLRIILKRTIPFDNIKGKHIFLIIGYILISSLLIIFIYMGINRILYIYIFDRADVFEHPTQKETLRVVIFAINIFVYVLGWVILYSVIKAFTLLNINRLDRVNLEVQLKESQLNTLKGQINPHFMFNSLNNIRGLMLEDVDRSREMLTRLSEMLRYSLTKNTVNAISIKDELEMVDNYIEISRIQLEERLKFTKEIDVRSTETSIPPMIIQLLVENAVKHGISKLKEGGLITLKITQDASYLSIKVTNSGKLKFEDHTTRLGLDNIKKRLQLLYGNAATFSLTEVNNEVIAHIKIPTL
ncbi:sensor histidine kinase [Flavobacteriaceae bacterium M23B6Z8]